jgi:hypothetical protein
MGTHTIVVKVEVLKRYVGGEEGHERRLHVKAEGIVVQVDGVKLGEVKHRGEKRGDSVGDLAEESTGEDIGEVCDLKEMCQRIIEAKIQGIYTYSEVLLGCKNLTERLAGANTQSVTQNANFLDVLRSKRGNMGLEILSSVELEALSLEGKDLIGRSHSISKRAK